MLDHIGFVVSDVERSRAFYDQALKPLGVKMIASVSPTETTAHTHYGYGEAKKPWFWISEGEQQSGPVHVAFTAASRADVDAFYAAAMAAGGRDNGGPGVRAHYHPNYYGAFVIDPDGHNVEAVCHAPA
ncbi:MAG: VOC family protein [Alphaproteobacteria bacterium]|nr:VOC family protein [Alphaproteobacteria bacterium]